MRCPKCHHLEDRVIDSRSTKEGRAIRRRRECIGCGNRYTTYEYVENASVAVVKRDGKREPFNREKVVAGISRACEKRPVSLSQMEAIVDRVENEIQKHAPGEVESRSWRSCRPWTRWPTSASPRSTGTSRTSTSSSTRSRGWSRGTPNRLPGKADAFP